MFLGVCQYYNNRISVQSRNIFTTQMFENMNFSMIYYDSSDLVNTNRNII